MAQARLAMDGGRLVVPITGLRIVGAEIAVQFIGNATRRALIAKLFTGAYRNEVPRVSARKVAAALLNKLLR
jgi:hypothetical protein